MILLVLRLSLRITPRVFLGYTNLAAYRSAFPSNSVFFVQGSLPFPILKKGTQVREQSRGEHCTLVVEKRCGGE